jgi:hypothetical protein
LASKIEENKIPLKVWSRRIKIAVAGLFIISTAFMNGVFTGQHEGAVIDRELTRELVSWNNLVATIRESWFAFVALFAYLLLRSYNHRLDLEEQAFIEARQREE